MAKNLLIVESPAKAKTINKYLGKDFLVLASYGHVRDLPGKDGAVNVDDNFAMRYEVQEKNQKYVDAITKAAKDASAIYLASDPDREGEAIAWHIGEILAEKGLLKDKALHRVVFTEVTPKAIAHAVEHPRAIASNLVDAYQARRALDHLVGFNLSPILWRKIKNGLSAGRVQSPALRLICEREDEIEAFISREHWSFTAQLQEKGQAFSARCVKLDGTKFEQFSITDGKTAEVALARLKAAAGSALKVAEVNRKERKRRPSPPFITSTLQQEAARKLGFTTKKTMQVAQKLYEGVNIGEEGTVGLISYMRTDSTSLSGEALGQLRDVIAREFGKHNVPTEANVYKSKSKNAQEAHEAIRPTFAGRTPARIGKYLSDDERRLYELIWKRAVACQMIPATLNTVSVELAAGPQHGFRATGTTVVDPGFLLVYEEGKDQKDSEDEEANSQLPPLAEGQSVTLDDILGEQHFTKPPPRYTEASLVKTLEEYGIGRPSTYSSIIQTLIYKAYALLESRAFRPTDVGRLVNRFLTSHFERYVDYDFTAKLEDELDSVSRGEEPWTVLMEKFWTQFKTTLDEKTDEVNRSEGTGQRDLGTDPVSGKPVSVRMGKYGAFAQIGSKDDEDKPKFASLRPEQSIFTLQLPEALKLFELPKNLGDFEDKAVMVAIGQFGPYVKHGDTFASIPKEIDPYQIELDKAVELIHGRREYLANRFIKTFEGTDIQILNGRFGPYITDGAFNAKIPKDREPASLTQDECEALLAEGKPVRKFGRAAKKATKKTAVKKAPAAKKAPAKKATKKTAKKKVTAKKAAKKATKKAAKKSIKKAAKKTANA
ncbi:DNA topoisomerase I [Arenimonas sp.]|jgi:DNA topoisomerase-1|uniref:DNA topoisomerase I n=1 Tax=Arenimonas sp. TaxID=1872635 RepID=UPI0037BF7617